MAHLKIEDLEKALSTCEEYVYVEVGKYKPYRTATVNAAKRRGYRVECKIRSHVYYVYPK